jgi:hypothetical protein
MLDIAKVFLVKDTRKVNQGQKRNDFLTCRIHDDDDRNDARETRQSEDQIGVEFTSLCLFNNGRNILSSFFLFLSRHVSIGGMIQIPGLTNDVFTIDSADFLERFFRPSVQHRKIAS